MTTPTLPDAVRDALERTDVEAALVATLAALAAESGTVHFVEADGFLHLAAHGPGMPPPVLERIAKIPSGKGMAGLALERSEPVTICNLQTDDSGDARPGAKATGLEGSIVVPIYDTTDRAIGTLGVANRAPRTFTDEEIALLDTIGRALALTRA